ncbi:hypothetical protein ACHAXR_006166 [Thalassiosira sp. AJA248-18]
MSSSNGERLPNVAASNNSDNNACEEEDDAAAVQQSNDPMGDDGAALLVMFYLLFIFALLVIAIVIGLFVVVQYGIVVLVAVSVAVFAMVIVGATLMSVITRDAKLRRARSKIKSWHVTCKDEILKEIENFREDFAAYTSGTLLLTYDDNYVDEEVVGSSNNGDQDLGQSTGDLENREASLPPCAATSKERKPKSIIFRFAIAPFTKSANEKGLNTQRKKKRIWKRQKKENGVEASNYQPPNIA